VGLRSGLVACGLVGVRLVISDTHPGLRDAIALDPSGRKLAAVPHPFLRNLLTRLPKSAGPFVATLVRSMFMQPDADPVWAQFNQVIEQLGERFTAAAEMLEAAGEEILGFSIFPKLICARSGPTILRSV
jgi:transposase-like protein